MVKKILLIIVLLFSFCYAYDYVVTDNMEVLDFEINFNQDNIYKFVLERARDYNGQFIADNQETEENEAYIEVTENKTIKEFTYYNVANNLLYIQITGGYYGTCFNSSKYPVTGEIMAYYESLGATINQQEYIEVLKNNIESDFK